MRDFTPLQLQQLQEKGIHPETVAQQLKRFKNGFPTLKLRRAALVGDGIVKISDNEKRDFIQLFEKQQDQLHLLKFVPASGAATRMFKFLHQFLQEFDPSLESINSFINRKDARDLFTFFVGVEKLPFYNYVIAALKKEHGNWQQMTDREKKERFVRKMLYSKEFNYSAMPKGLVPFHGYKNHTATAFEEHLYEAAGYAASQGEAYLHFTIAPDFKDMFTQEFERIEELVERKTGKNFEISYSYQKPSTDTIAVDMNNQPIVDDQGHLFFRPAGHGALLDNLNDQEADIIFIKNIDNVTIRSMCPEIEDYKKMLAGMLLQLQQQTFYYLRQLDQENPSDKMLKEMEDFVTNKLNATLPRDYGKYRTTFQLEAIRDRLNRPLRVCGMVENEGEPGGGPFWVTNQYGEDSLQIVESAQVDKDDHRQRHIAANCTHFNPVDLVCGVRDYKGNKFNLHDYRDLDTGFITYKTNKGNKLKAQELPGLWNGAMAHWNTVFVEVPLVTFNPVKNVNDLLKPAHQA